MPQGLRADPATLAAVVEGAFAVMAARIGARQDSRLLVDNELVAREVCDIVALSLEKLDERLGAPAPDSDAHAPDIVPPPDP